MQYLPKHAVPSGGYYLVLLADEDLRPQHGKGF